MFGLRKKHIAKNLYKNMSKRLKVSQSGKKDFLKVGTTLVEIVHVYQIMTKMNLIYQISILNNACHKNNHFWKKG